MRIVSPALQQPSWGSLALRWSAAYRLGRYALMALLLACAPGCGDETALDPTAPPDEPVGGGGPVACEPGEIEGNDGTCQPAGLPPDLPPPGPAEPPAAGVPPDQCAAGFESDGEGGCDPILPAEPCPPGLMAVPGETECREVAPCGQGTWGDIPVEPDTQHVDQSFVGASDGSSSSPWTTIQEGVDAAAPGAIVAVAAGSYAEDVVLSDQAVRLWGRCPELAEIVGAGGDDAVLVDGASGSEIRDLAVTGLWRAVFVQNASQVEVHQVWVHDTGSLGVTYLDCTAGVLTDSLLEQVTGNAVEVVGSDVTIERIAVRDIQLIASGDFGRGLEVVYDSPVDLPAAVVLRGSIFERCHEAGVAALSADLEVVATAIRDTLPNETAEPAGHGLIVGTTHDTRASGVVTGTVLDGNREDGILLFGSDLTIESTTVRRCVPNADGQRGNGITIYPGLGNSPADRSVATVRSSLVADAYNVGVTVLSSDVTLDRVVVREVQPTSATGLSGYGIYVGTRSSEIGLGSVHIESCLVDRSHHSGVISLGAELTLENSVVRDTLPPEDGSPAAGLFFAPDDDLAQSPVATVRSSLVEGSHGMGILAEDGSVAVVSTVIRDTQPSPAAPDYGFGVLVNHMTDGLQSIATVDGCIVSQSHNQGVVVVGSELTLYGTVVRDTQIGQGTTGFGRGLELQPNDEDHRSAASVRFSVFEGNHDTEVFVWSSDLVLEGSIAQDTLMGTDGAGNAYGVVVTGGPDDVQRASAVVRGSILRRNAVAGVVVSASDLTLESTLVTDTAPQASSQGLGRCIGAQSAATVAVRHCRLQRCHENGVVFIEADGRIVDSVVAEIWPRASDELFGDGIAITLGERAGSLELLRTRVETTSRAGVVSFGAPVTVTDSTFECNPIHLDAEVYPSTMARFTDGGGNTCGCDGVPVECAVTSTNLAPPGALPE